MTTKQSKHYRGVFRQVMTQYDDIRSTLGTNSCEPFYSRLAREGNGGSANPRVIKMLPADFLADVELAARRVLSEYEHYYFKTVYLKKNEKFDAEFKSTVSDKAYSSMKHAVQEKLGHELQRVKIHPVEQYMRSIDLR